MVAPVANFMYGLEVRTLVDVGGQEIKAIQCDDNDKVSDFLTNDKDVAGTGCTMAELIQEIKRGNYEGAVL